MAKQAVSPVERHLEKGVFGLALVVLAGVVVKFLITSPNTIDLGGRTVGPGEVYQSMASDAEQLRNTIRNKKPNTASVPDQSERFKALVSAAHGGRIPAPVSWGPRVPDVDATKVEQGNIELVSVLPFGKPVVQVGRSGAEMAPPEPVTEIPDEIKSDVAVDPAYVVPVNWVTVSATLDIDAQRQLALDRKYLPGQATPHFAGAELQRREKRWDGSYGEWELIKSYAPYVMPDLPFVEVEVKDDKPAVAEAMIAKVDAFKKVIETGWFRIQLIRPLPPRIDYGDWWDPVQMEGLELLRLDDEIINGEEPGCPFYDRYPKKPKPKPKPIDQMTQPEKVKLVRDAIDAVDALVKQGCHETADAQAQDLLRNSGKQIQDIDSKEYERLVKLADQAKALAAKKLQEDKQRQDRGEQPPPRKYSPVQIVWAHDALQNSAVSGKTYQYRMRPLLFNSFCGQTMQLKNPKDAEIVLLQGEWSDPSDDVTIPSDTEFYLVRGKEDNQTAKVEVFRWYEGDWVKATFDVTVGAPIGGRESIKLKKDAPATRIEFNTGARVVDLRFDHPYRERKEKSKGGFDLGEAKPTLIMVYVDASGEVHQRVLDEDKRDPRYKELREALARADGRSGP